MLRVSFLKFEDIIQTYLWFLLVLFAVSQFSLEFIFVCITIAMSFAMLEAHELGLGTCWMANYTEPELRAALGLPDDISVVAIMPVGYADEDPAPKPRKPVDEIVRYISSPPPMLIKSTLADA